MTRKKKTILAIVIVLILAAAAALIWFLRSSGSSSSGSVYIQSVNDVNAAGISSVNRYSGVIETQKTDKVEFDTSKKFKEIYVNEGDRVAKGDALFSYDTESIELQIQQAQLSIEKLNTTVANDNDQIAQLQKDMASASSADKPSYSAQIQELQAEIAQTQYDIKTKQAEIDKLTNSISSATVTAKMDGTVESIADLDALLAGTLTDSTGNQSNVYITILADGELRVKGKTSEQNIQTLYQDMTVIVRSRVDQSITWTGTISSIDTQSSSDDNNNYFSASGERASSYAFYVNLDSIDGLMLGQHVTIEPDYGQTTVKDGIWLSSGWITQNDDGTAYVWAAKSEGAKLEKRTVELGEYDSNLDEYQITSGLAASDYLAWPDVDCVVGASTTTEYVMDDSNSLDRDFSYTGDDSSASSVLYADDTDSANAMTADEAVG